MWANCLEADSAACQHWQSKAVGIQTKWCHDRHTKLSCYLLETGGRNVKFSLECSGDQREFLLRHWSSRFASVSFLSSFALCHLWQCGGHASQSFWFHCIYLYHWCFCKCWWRHSNRNLYEQIKNVQKNKRTKLANDVRHIQVKSADFMTRKCENKTAFCWDITKVKLQSDMI